VAASIERRLHLAAPTEKAHRRKAVTALVKPKPS